MGGRVELAPGRERERCLVKGPRKQQDAELDIRTTRAGVVVRRTFPGAVLKPPGPRMPPEPGPALVVQDAYCVFCHSTRVVVNVTELKHRWYRCFSCVDPETGDWTTFKLPRRAPPTASPSSPAPSPSRPSSPASQSPAPPGRPRG